MELLDHVGTHRVIVDVLRKRTFGSNYFKLADSQVESTRNGYDDLPYLLVCVHCNLLLDLVRVQLNKHFLVILLVVLFEILQLDVLIVEALNVGANEGDPVKTTLNVELSCLVVDRLQIDGDCLQLSHEGFHKDFAVFGLDDSFQVDID